MATKKTLGAATLENQLLEIIEPTQRMQSIASNNPDGATVVTAYTRNMATGLVTVSLSIPTDDVLDPTDGSIDVIATELFVD